ncbi:MAG: hypothetical protein ACXWJM_10430 [Ramlibacter sp.]
MSDGLYAIALTLLVLELKLPSLGHAATNADLLHALGALLNEPGVHVDASDPSALRTLRVRSYVLPACAASAVALGFFVPGWNMLAMLPMLYVRGVARA